MSSKAPVDVIYDDAKQKKNIFMKFPRTYVKLNIDQSIF